MGVASTGEAGKVEDHMSTEQAWCAFVVALGAILAGTAAGWIGGVLVPIPVVVWRLGSRYIKSRT